jgi:hypothetical protein
VETRTIGYYGAVVISGPVQIKAMEGAIIESPDVMDLVERAAASITANAERFAKGMPRESGRDPVADQMRTGVIAYLGQSVEHGDARIAGALALMVSVLFQTDTFVLQCWNGPFRFKLHELPGAKTQEDRLALVKSKLEELRRNAGH